MRHSGVTTTGHHGSPVHVSICQHVDVTAPFRDADGRPAVAARRPRPGASHPRAYLFRALLEKRAPDGCAARSAGSVTRTVIETKCFITTASLPPGDAIGSNGRIVSVERGAAVRNDKTEMRHGREGRTSTERRGRPALSAREPGEGSGASLAARGAPVRRAEAAGRPSARRRPSPTRGFEMRKRRRMKTPSYNERR